MVQAICVLLDDVEALKKKVKALEEKRREDAEQLEYQLTKEYKLSRELGKKK